MSPMSWQAGSQKTAFVSRPTSKALLMARVLARRLAWLSMTPLGRLVEPEVYWIIASESGSGSCSVQPSAWTSVNSSVAIQRTAAVLTVHCLHIGDGGGGAEHQRRSGVADERVEAIERSCPGRVDGHGDTAGVERTEKGGDEFEAGRVGKHDIPTREPHVLEVRGDGPGAPVQLRVGQRRLRRIAIEQVHESGVVGAFRGMIAQAAHDVPATRSRVGEGPRRDPDRGRSLEPQQRNACRTRRRAGDFVVRQIVLGAADRVAVVLSHRIDQMRPHLIDGECRPSLERHCGVPSRCRMEFRRTVVRMPPP